ncbi:MAG TPA: hypothetical protein VK752_05165 [Bryobacteraceae bacterium]|jgi:hypothetical protein|nr:hypothetical protein [Bryobacteraceae bacterium]
MKMLLMLAMAGLSFAQTPLATGSRVFVMLPTGHVQLVAIDPATLQVVNGVLSVIPPAAATLPLRIVEITQVAAVTPTYTLGQAPNTAPELDIFWNGLCLSVGVDYTVAANVVTFTGWSGPGIGDVLRVVYRGT